MRAFIIPALAASALACGGAQAQERTGMPAVAGAERGGMPAVNPRRATADPDAAMYRTQDEFRSWSRKAGNPRILLFWNVALTDESSSRYRLRAQEDVTVEAYRGTVTRSTDAVIEAERTTGGPSAWLDRDDEGDLESAYVTAFVRAGANLVDRAALMRKVSAARNQDDRVDQQFMETLAVEEGIDYLVEVLPEYRSGSATGMIFGIRVLHVPSSRVVATFRTEARPAAGPERLVARPGGFQRERDERITPDLVAETLASETMRGFL
ncbi:hypothetical protein [Sphingobium lignivorans]|uniref:Uncharacterized protein n=1 Tax=Sphingobium lignivorans TaxID=2735886 RepID=A0ABR6NEN6_9SPHN|nr:hypothetical protein [Sphingobium lignivorans]MBB5985742.1 hypothetical protein [Sphingobium lignivorans]